MTTEAVAILSNVYDTYANLAQADLYLAAKFGSDAWFDLTEDQRGQLLVSAVRVFEGQCWLGEKTEEGQPLAWPRTGTGLDDVVDNLVPDGIINGSIELAYAIFDGSDVVNSSVPGAQKLRSLSAGSVNLQWFRGAEGLNARYDRFPLPVQELIKRFLCSSSGTRKLVVSGVCGESVTNDDLGYNEGV